MQPSPGDGLHKMSSPIFSIFSKLKVKMGSSTLTSEPSEQWQNLPLPILNNLAIPRLSQCLNFHTDYQSTTKTSDELARPWLASLCSKALCLALWVKFSADNILKYFIHFPQKTRLDISCKLSPMETICMKFQILFTGKHKKKFTNLSSAELAQRCEFSLSMAPAGSSMKMEFSILDSHLLRM